MNRLAAVRRLGTRQHGSAHLRSPRPLYTRLPAARDRPGTSDPCYLGSEFTDFDIIAREVSGHRTRLEAIEKRLDEVEKVNARLEDAALTTGRALGEISGHWNAVCEAMRRKDETQLAPEQ
jgi:hypothetical protein